MSRRIAALTCLLLSVTCAAGLRAGIRYQGIEAYQGRWVPATAPGSLRLTRVDVRLLGSRVLVSLGLPCPAGDCPTAERRAHLYAGALAYPGEGPRLAAVSVDFQAGSEDLQVFLRIPGDGLLEAEVFTRRRGFLHGHPDTVVRIPLIRPGAPWLAESCVPLDARRALVRQTHGRWQLLDGPTPAMDFGDDKRAADAVLRLLRGHQVDQVCSLDSTRGLRFFLSQGQSIEGPAPGEDCAAFSSEDLQLELRAGAWVLTAGELEFQDFGARQLEASSALLTIRKHGFTRLCELGSRRTRVSYLRR